MTSFRSPWRAFDHVEGFEPRFEGAFFAYLRRILMNRIRDEIRRVRWAAAGRTRSEFADAADSPLDTLLKKEERERWAALER
jgi:DNA-directed RNA polymerase specialized sigma24 family protein